jgi:hypothetical protein
VEGGVHQLDVKSTTTCPLAKDESVAAVAVSAEKFGKEDNDFHGVLRASQSLKAV